MDSKTEQKKTTKKKNKNSRGGKILKQHEIKKKGETKGHLYVDLKDDNRASNITKVCKMVAIAFVPNPHNKKNIRHKDGNIHNNKATNLEWVD
jgi:hypothetical protein